MSESPTKRDDMPTTCQGANCGKARDDQAHSIECIAETAASQGWMPPLPVGEVREVEPGRFVKQPVSDDQYYTYALQYAEQRVREEREACIEACRAEHLEDPQDREDHAYDGGVFDCIAAIRRRSKP